MSRTALIGSVGLARQSAKDSVASSLSYMPVTSTGLSPNQNTATLPPEIGGGYFLRGSYKGSFAGAGDISLVVRPNGIGHYLMAYSGQDNVIPVPGQAGAYQHTFTPFLPAANVDLPWYTILKDNSKLFAQQFLNSKLSSLRLDVPMSSIATAQSTWVSTTPTSVASPSSPTVENTPAFQTSQGVIALTQEGSGSNISANSIKMQRITLNLANSMSNDEYSVGNLYLDDVTLLQKAISVDMDLIIRDEALYDAVYQNGVAAPTVMASAIYRGAFTVTLNSSSNVPTTTQPYQMVFTFPGLDFLMMPISLQGADLVRATLSTQVTLGPSGSDTYTITLINGVASY